MGSGTKILGWAVHKKTFFCGPPRVHQGSMEKMNWGGPKWGREVIFLANPDLVDILGDMDLDFENCHSGYFLDSKFLDFQVPRFPNSGLA